MRPLLLSCIAILCAALVVAGAAAQTAGAGFQGMPREIRDEVERVRKECVALLPSYAPGNEMQGLMLVKLGDQPAIVVDNLGLCSNHVPGANCSNRGCDVAIWRQDRSGAWQQVFKEHLHTRAFLFDRANERLEGLSADMYAGHPWCHPRPGKDYTSGQSCRLTIRYIDGKWVPPRVK